MIKQFRVQNYKALRDVTLDLTPLHVLIGPNDSGKTSILEALAAFGRSVDYPLNQAFLGSWKDNELVWHKNPHLVLELSSYLIRNDVEAQYSVTCRTTSSGRTIRTENEKISIPSLSNSIQSPHTNNDRTWVRGLTHDAWGENDINNRELIKTIHYLLTGVHYYRWIPRFLAMPVAPDSQRRFRMDTSGFGLALCLDDILGYDRDRFNQLENRFRQIFPQIMSIKLIAEPAYKSPVDTTDQIPAFQAAEGKGLYFEFKNDGQLIPAAQMSDGIMLVLAYLTILYLPKPPRLLLIEEPENGIHPKRLLEVMTILRQLVEEQSHTQVVLTTHSPYVLDLFQPEEVTLCRKGEDGAVTVHRLSDSQTVREQLDVFTLGEIWTAEGDEKLAQSTTPDAERAQ